MESILRLDKDTISTETLTPESEEISVENANIPRTKREEDAFILKDTSNLLPSPPPHDNIYNPPTKRKALTSIKLEVEEDKLELVEKGCKWCQRCGTFETPRWRYGPGGPLSLCNACHLRWKTVGRPDTGYSATSFPPPFYDASPRQAKRKYSKTNIKRQKKEANKENRLTTIPKLKENMPLSTLPITSESPLSSSLSSSSLAPPPPPPPPPPPMAIPLIIPGACTQCQTTNTPLWRRGPFGFRTLCNACGLKWSKETDNGQSSANKAATSVEYKASGSVQYKPPVQYKKPVLLRQKKEFIKHGLYSEETRVEVVEKTPFQFKLPIHQGEFIMSKVQDFELPVDILEERDLGLIKGLMADREPFFTRIRSNIFVERKPQHKANEQAVCHCVPPTEEGQMGCGEDCINRMLFYECEPKYCPCASQCSNQRFQRKERKKGLQVFQTEGRGWGLRTTGDIKKGDLVIEYRGEIISHELCEERMCTVYVNEKNFYFLDYCNGEVIDACTKGTEARFINHSCDPNCHIEKWSLKGESHYGVFASVDIGANSELFYDYNFSTFNGSVESQQTCYCGSKLCRGTIGKKTSGITRIK
ncbi:hypothetical protein INT47_002316 [Mucor saturninus]|uniref:Uncharacterized protein n=1 Tax=Mucor saturninus TaxID=64648 RepID=A0A8H7UWY5_9FUNG|nr:hypothetical protein INT47_002316 [Mucor saturninus]